jgi:hypothetical protein
VLERAGQSVHGREEKGGTGVCALYKAKDRAAARKKREFRKEENNENCKGVREHRKKKQP